MDPRGVDDPRAEILTGVGFHGRRIVSHLDDVVGGRVFTGFERFELVADPTVEAATSEASRNRSGVGDIIRNGERKMRCYPVTHA